MKLVLAIIFLFISIPTLARNLTCEVIGQNTSQKSPTEYIQVEANQYLESIVLHQFLQENGAYVDYPRILYGNGIRGELGVASCEADYNYVSASKAIKTYSHCIFGSHTDVWMEVNLDTKANGSIRITTSTWGPTKWVISLKPCK